MRIAIIDPVSPGIRAMLASSRGSQILSAMGTAVKLGVQNHLLALPANKMGWPKTGFYKRAARATTLEISRFQSNGAGTTRNRATVSVNHLGLAQRYFGGDIKPVRAKLLTIPARQEAYGKRAREFNNLRVAFNRRGPFALVENDAQEVNFGRVRKDGTRAVKRGQIVGGGIMYWLVDRVHQNADPSVLPTDSALAGWAESAGAAYIDRQTRKENLA